MALITFANFMILGAVVGIGSQVGYGSVHIKELNEAIVLAQELQDEWKSKYEELNSAYLTLEAGIDAYTADLVQLAIVLRRASEAEVNSCSSKS